ncbi:threonine--tRNA ligase [Candidatus Micrarchaeota archaeon]|nr:threonine--tRNA ligase [Candidatus Micrarchaeota archaeon]
MRILTVHSDYIEVEPLTKAIKDAEELPVKEKKRYEEVLVVFTAVEEGDEKNIQGTVERYVQEVKSIVEQVKAKNILIYPYAHLSSNLSKPNIAQEFLIKAEKELSKELTVSRAPFGWYKSFNISCKGHPLSELSRAFSVEDDSNNLQAIMETISHLVYDTAKKLTGKAFISISEINGNKSILNWRELDGEITHEFLKKLEIEANKNREKNLDVKEQEMDRKEALKLCGDIYDRSLPREASKIRVVAIGDLPPEPCRHPHVSNTKEVKEKIKIDGFEKTEGKFRIMIHLGEEENAKDKDLSKALKAEKTLVSHFYIIGTDGKLNEISYDKEKKKFTGFDFSKHENLRKLVAYELTKDRIVTEEPPHVRLMRKLELVDYEDGSDPGNLRYYPKGRFMKGLIERYVTQIIKENGGMEIETPIMYDYEHPSLKSYLNRFPARQYAIETPNKKVFLRFAGCFGGFLLAHDAHISYKQLPVWIYELTRYSFRVEQRGELSGLRRLRAFTMPDCHALCRDEEQAKEQLIKRFDLSREFQNKSGVGCDNLEFAVRVTKKFVDENGDFVKGLVKRWGRPALLEVWDEQFFYFVFKYEFNFVDVLGKASTLTTDQIDVENGKRYGIEYIDEKGQKKNPLILHLSPSGAIERIIYALLEKAAMDQRQGKIPMLPLWLSPTQVRLMPVSNEKHLKYCEELEKKLSKESIRVDIDDRQEGIGKKIRDAGQEWMPYSVVIGDKELGKQEINVRDREKNEEIEMKIDDLVKLIKEKTEGMPFDTIPTPRKLSKNIIFVG